MLVFRGLLGLFGLGVLVLASSSTTTAAADPVPSYTKDIQPFLNKYCVECHSAKQAKAGYNFETYQGLMKAGKKGAGVVAGKPDQSVALKTMTGQAKTMPPKKVQTRPTGDEIATFRKWIMGGARDDSKADGK